MTSPDRTLSSPLSRRSFLLRGAGFAGLAFTGADLLAACGSSSKSSSPTTVGNGGATGAKRGGTLKIGVTAPLAAVDPVLMYDGGSISVAQQVCEYLIWVENDGSLRPVLAQSWSPDATAKVWTFKLRPNVTFSDGTPFTADDVVATMALLTAPNTKSSALSNFKGILGPTGTVKVDDLTVAFNLNTPFADFPYLVSSTNYNTLMLPKSYSGNFQSHPVGTGPFLLQSYTTDQSATFVRNPKYWGAPKPYLDGVNFTFFKDQNSVLLAYQGGTIDVMGATSTSELATLKGAAGTVLHAPGSATYTMWMRQDKAPFTDKRVRQAVAWAIDRTGLVSSVLNGDAQVGNDHFFGPTMPLKPTNLTQRSQDLKQAKQLLQDAGAVGQNVTLTTENTPPAPDYATLVKNDLAKIGLNVTLNVMDQTAFYGSGANQPWLEVPFGIVDWAARSIPSQFLIPVMTSTGVWNSPHYKNPDLDALITQYNGELDKTKRQDLVNQIAKVSWDDVPVIVGYWQGGDRAASSKVHALAASPSSFLDLSSTWLS